MFLEFVLIVPLEKAQFLLNLETVTYNIFSYTLTEYCTLQETITRQYIFFNTFFKMAATK